MGLADVLITRGWHQGNFEGPDGSVCLEGALCVVMGLDWKIEEEGSAYAMGPEFKVLSEITGTSPCAFNDNCNTTYDDVLRVAKEYDEKMGL